jgi:predicted RNase H-like HicB family nuclease
MALYPALSHKEGKSAFGVSFPDFPGCISAGDTIDEAHAMAREALDLHIEGMMEDGEAIPAPSSLEDIAREYTGSKATAIIMVPASVKPKAVRINITVPEDFLNDVDKYVSEHNLTRSGFLVSAARKAIDKAA